MTDKLVLTHEDLKIIKDFEGLYLDAYPDPATGAEPITIGYGSTRHLDGSKIKLGEKINEQEALELLMHEVNEICPKIQSLVTVELNKNQLVALVSFVYNLGLGNFSSSTLLKLLNQAKYTEAADQFVRWNKAAGKVMAGLTRRREAEKALFLS
jgi:lysozyme